MALAYTSTLRNAQLDAITTAVGGSGKLKFYHGSQPATGGTATTLLATCTLNPRFAASASGGVLTLNAITSDTNAVAGTATWARMTTSADGFVMDMTVGTSGTDIVMDNNVFTTGGTVAVSSFTITNGNP